MAITTLDAAIAGARPPEFITKAVTGTLVAGQPRSLWYLAGQPGAGSAGSTLAGTALISPVTGQIPFTNTGTANRNYIFRFVAACTQPGTLILADRLWHNGGYTITLNTAQTVNSVAWPARDNNESTNGEGVILGLEVSGAVGAGTPTITIGYTNSGNTASRTGVNTIATTASAAQGSFFPIGLQAGDTGVRSVQNLTLSATWTSGTISLVAYRPLLMLELPVGNTSNAVDAITSGFPKMSENSVPFLIFIPSTTTTSNVTGSLVYTQG